MLRRHFVVALVVPPVLLLASCGKKPPETGLVQGVVLVKGKPMSRLAVTFMPEPSDGKEVATNAFAETDEQGKYQLKHYFNGKELPGAPVGWNRVLVEDLRQSHLGQGQARPPQFISFDYAKPSTTPLRVEIKPGEQTINLEVTR